MKNIKPIILLVGILVAGLALNSVAQTPEKTRPAKEHRVTKHDKHKDKHKEKHKAEKVKAKPHDKNKHKAKSDAK